MKSLDEGGGKIREKGDVTTEVEEVMQPRAKQCGQPLKTGKAKERTLL